MHVLGHPNMKRIMTVINREIDTTVYYIFLYVTFISLNHLAYN